MGILGRTRGILAKVNVKGIILAHYIDKLMEYYFGAHGLKASPLERVKFLSAQPPNNCGDCSSLQTPTRIAIFAAYANTLTASNRAYLQALNQAGFAVMYITNATTLKSEIPDILTLTWRALDRVNIGRDIGAYKDGILLLQSEGLLDKCELLGMFNDSVTFIPGKNAEELVKRINSFSESPCKGLFSHASFDLYPHYQSFFQVLKPEIFRSDRFIDFWAKYRHISHRGHSIYNGEVALSTNVYNHFGPIDMLLSTHSLVATLLELDKTAGNVLCSDLVELLPSPAKTIDNGADGYSLTSILAREDISKRISAAFLYSIAELIEGSNPSHMAAFLYPMYLQCPLVKNDICSAGTYSLAQAATLLGKVLDSSANADVTSNERRLILEDFIRLTGSKGTPRSYAKRAREAAIKGITSGFVYPRA